MERVLFLYAQGALATTWYSPTIKECYTGSYTYRWDYTYDRWHVGAAKMLNILPLRCLGDQISPIHVPHEH